MGESIEVLAEKIAHINHSIKEVLNITKQNSMKTDELKIDIEKIKSSYTTSRNIWSVVGGILCLLIGTLYAQGTELDKKQDEKIDNVITTEHNYQVITDDKIAQLELRIQKDEDNK